MTKNAERYKDIGAKLRRDDPEDAKLIDWVEEKKREGITASQLFRYLAMREKRKEEKYERESEY